MKNWSIVCIQEHAGSWRVSIAVFSRRVNIAVFSRVWRIDSRVVTRQKCHTCEACRKLKGQYSWITVGQKVQSGHSVSWRLELATYLSRESLTKATCFVEKMSFYIPSHTLLYIPMKCRKLQREFWEKNSREQQDWFIHNLICLTLQIPLLSPAPLTYPWEDL